MIKKLLDDEIETKLRTLAKEELKSDVYAKSVDSIIKLTDRSIEIERNEIDAEIKAAQVKDEKHDRFIKNCIAVGTTIITVGATIILAKATFTFEEEGTISSNVGKMIINSMAPKRVN